jgi:hypothetical protein
MLQRVVALAGPTADPHPIGVLSSDNRDTYAEVRRHRPPPSASLSL